MLSGPPGRRVFRLRVFPFERQDVGHDTDFARELPRVPESAVVNELDEEGREPLGRFHHTRDVDTRQLLRQRRRRVRCADDVEPEIARLRVGGLPEIDCGRPIRDLDADRSVGRPRPRELRPRPVREDRLVEGEKTFTCIAAAQVVPRVRNVADVLLTLEVLEVEPRVIGEEELVARRGPS
jgi:hypothetical protein